MDNTDRCSSWASSEPLTAGDVLDAFDLLIALGVEAPAPHAEPDYRARSAAVYAAGLPSFSRVELLLSCALHASRLDWWPHPGAIVGRRSIARYMLTNAGES